MRFLVSDFLLPSPFIVRPGLGFSDCGGEMGQQSLTYSFVARGRHTWRSTRRSPATSTASPPAEAPLQQQKVFLIEDGYIHGGDREQQQKQKQKRTMQVRPCTGVLLLDMVGKHREKM
ncbi:uncharacterized protein LOC121970495 [Zingiber officinale]|uniref:uncharacterized protein LOC121970495 n=1 Tax=Zingiber officinale TaxID=94328 RepID=UPI001C4B0850|nr:uncharacterized protein LOC121970495 [Zingiber officinale]